MAQVVVGNGIAQLVDVALQIFLQFVGCGVDEVYCLLGAQGAEGLVEFLALGEHSVGKAFPFMAIAWREAQLVERQRQGSGIACHDTHYAQQDAAGIGGEAWVVSGQHRHYDFVVVLVSFSSSCFAQRRSPATR